jgi:SAM-dependent methyltransferase
MGHFTARTRTGIEIIHWHALWLDGRTHADKSPCATRIRKAQMKKGGNADVPSQWLTHHESSSQPHLAQTQYGRPIRAGHSPLSASEDMTYSRQANGIFMPDVTVIHRDEEYDSRLFSLLRDIQMRHFWYLGRHRFLLRALNLHLPGSFGTNTLAAIDLGGGCGGWITYLQKHSPNRFKELALSDSSLRALELAGPIVGQDILRYQTDLLRLGWRDRWHVAFLLDVLEHIPSDTDALFQITNALKPGGLLFVTTPALNCFWSYNDEIAHHLRRYTKHDFARLAQATGLRLLRASYFMFFLSPLLWLRRMRRLDIANMDKNEICSLVERTHRVPAPLLNFLMKLIFDLETPLGLRSPLPWGTSILGVFQKRR